MINNIQMLGYGVVALAIMIGVGSIVLQKFGGATAECTRNNNATDIFAYNSTADTCQSNVTGSTTTEDPKDQGWVNTHYLGGQLGTTGLAGWIPAIIAFTIGMLFLGYFMARGGKGRTM